MGLYQRKGIWYIRYANHKGKVVRESSGSEKKSVAKALLQRRMVDDANGKLPGDVRFEKMVEGIENDYAINNRKSEARLKTSLMHLKGFFGNIRASKIDTALVNEYIKKRLSAGVSNATVNRETRCLSKMLSLAERAGQINRKPHIEQLKEAAPRAGFFEHADFLAVREAMPGFLKGWFTFGYLTGWRRSEISKLRWEQIDRKDGIIRLEPGTTKNDAPRTLYMSNDLRAVIEWQYQLRLRSGKIQPFVFPNEDGTGHVYRPDRTWERAFKNAKVPRKLFHDLRRTAIRNLVRAGVSEAVCMKISGHKNRDVFSRYNITSADDLRLAAEKQAAYLGQLPTAKEHKTSTLVDFSQYSQGKCVVSESVMSTVGK